MTPDQKPTTPPTFVAPSGEKHTGDRVATTVLLVASAIVAAFVAFAGLMLIFMTDSCGASSVCDTGSFTTFWILAMAAPVVGFVVTLSYTLVRVKQGKSSSWVPIVGTLLYCGAFAGAVALAMTTIN